MALDLEAETLIVSQGALIRGLTNDLIAARARVGELEALLSAALPRPTDEAFLPEIIRKELALHVAGRHPKEVRACYAKANGEWADAIRKGADNDQRAKAIAAQIANPQSLYLDHDGNVLI